MQYRTNPKNGDRISQLGLGCMRFPKTAGRVDQRKANALVSAAIDRGINYFDTAYVYSGNEAALGTALTALGKRDGVFIGTKLPHYLCKKPEDFDRIFSKQLENLQTGWIDYYHIHMLGNAEAWERLKALGFEKWAGRKREEGKIKNLGFSFHGGRDDFLGLLGAFDWDFCLLQFNYYDENNQAGVTGVKAAHEKGMPVFVMGPVRGGMLSDDLPEEARQAFGRVNKERSPADWALRWVLDHPEVTMALSGMSSLAQVEENSATAGEVLPGMLGEAELAVYTEAAAILNKGKMIPCTKCGYCLPCPNGVNIPGCFACYNISHTFGLISGISQYMQVTGQTTPVRSDAAICTACGICQPRCPQGIPIASELAKVRRRMLTVVSKPIFRVARKFLGIK